MTLTEQSSARSFGTAVTPSGILLSNLEQHIDQLMARYVGTEVAGISISVVQNGQIVFAKGYGYADNDAKRPIIAETTYLEPGSVSKLFTWTAVMQLVEQGKIDLHADIRQYLPKEYLKLRYKEPVTMQHLMTHTAGFEERLEGLIISDPNLLVSLEEYLGPKRQPKQIYRPGTVIAYSNFSTSLAGLIVQQISGMPFEQYIDQHIFAPLGMQNSYFAPRYDQIEGVMEKRAKGHAKTKKGWKVLPDFYINDMPAGSMNSTSTDLARFLIAHLNRDSKLFAKPETFDLMHSVAFTHDPLLPGNAHGFWERFAGEHRVLEHGGNTNGFSALVAMVPEQKFGIAVLTNTAGEVAGARVDLVNLLIGSTYTNPNPETDRRYNHSTEVAGTYRSARRVDSSFMRVLFNTMQPDTKVVANPDGSIQVIMPQMKISSRYVETAPYFYQRCDTTPNTADKAGWDSNRIRFVTDDQGKVTAMSQGVIADLLRVSPSDSALLNQGMLGFAGITMLVGFISALVSLWRNRSKLLVTFNRDTNKLSLLGAANIVNLIVMSVRIAGDPCQPMRNFTPFRAVFWINTALSGYFGYRLSRNWGDTPIGQKAFAALQLSAHGVFTTYLAKNKFLRLP
jgi:CubicO group peptidase (beta-lactamase class C family)